MLDEYAVLYNLIFILILVIVCGCASLFAMWLNKRMKFQYWLFSTVYFVAITFTTIILWHYVIGLTF